MLVDTELALGLSADAITTAAEALARDPKDLATFQWLMGVFDHYDALPLLLTLLESLATRTAEPEAQGDLLFFQGEIHRAAKADAAARRCYAQARLQFEKVFPAEHPVYGVLGKALGALGPAR